MPAATTTTASNTAMVSADVDVTRQRANSDARSDVTGDSSLSSATGQDGQEFAVLTVVLPDGSEYQLSCEARLVQRCCVSRGGSRGRGGVRGFFNGSGCVRGCVSGSGHVCSNTLLLIVDSGSIGYLLKKHIYIYIYIHTFLHINMLSDE